MLLGVAKEDDEADARYLVDKIANLRIFADAADDPAVAAFAEDDHLTVAWTWFF